jgi:accessory gene regulator B
MSIVLVISVITGDFVNAIVAVLAFPALRYFSGGFHLNSAAACNIISATLVMIAIYTPVNYWYTGIILNLLSMIILFVYAPSGIKKSKLPKSSYPFLKVIAVAIVSTNLLFQSPVLSIVFFLQAITTLPAFKYLMDRTKL